MAQALPLYALHVDLAPGITGPLREDFTQLERALQEGIRHAYQVLAQEGQTSSPPRRIAVIPLRGANAGVRAHAEAIRRESELQIQGLLYSASLPDTGPALALHGTSGDDDPPGIKKALEDLRRKTETELNRLRLRVLEARSK